MLATQNPLEMEGTYPLPEAQLDRFFFKLHVPFPTRRRAARDPRPHHRRRTRRRRAGDQRRPCWCRCRGWSREVPIARTCRTTPCGWSRRPTPTRAKPPAPAKHYVRYGASPRGVQALILAGKISALLEGRYNVAIDDLRAAAQPALRHRVILNFEGRPKD